MPDESVGSRVNQTRTYRPRAGLLGLSRTAPPAPDARATGCSAAMVGMLPTRNWRLAPLALPSSTVALVIVTV